MGGGKGGLGLYQLADIYHYRSNSSDTSSNSSGSFDETYTSELLKKIRGLEQPQLNHSDAPPVNRYVCYVGLNLALMYSRLGLN